MAGLPFVMAKEVAFPSIPLCDGPFLFKGATHELTMPMLQSAAPLVISVHPFSPCVSLSFGYDSASNVFFGTSTLRPC